MQGWPFAEAARKPIDSKDVMHQYARRMQRDLDERKNDEEKSNQTRSVPG